MERYVSFFESDNNEIINDQKISRKWEIIKVDESEDFCQLCGKRELKRVVWIKELDTGNEYHAGVVCAAKRLHIPVKKVNDKIDDFLKEKYKKIENKFDTDLRNGKFGDDLIIEKGDSLKYILDDESIRKYKYNGTLNLYVIKKIRQFEILARILKDNDLLDWVQNGSGVRFSQLDGLFWGDYIKDFIKRELS